MQEKIADEWDKPDYITLSVGEYQRLKETIDIYEQTIRAIKSELEIINSILEEMDEEI